MVGATSAAKAGRYTKPYTNPNNALIIRNSPNELNIGMYEGSKKMAAQTVVSKDMVTGEAYVVNAAWSFPYLLSLWSFDIDIIVLMKKSVQNPDAIVYMTDSCQPIVHPANCKIRKW